MALKYIRNRVVVSSPIKPISLVTVYLPKELPFVFKVLHMPVFKPVFTEPSTKPGTFVILNKVSIEGVRNLKRGFQFRIFTNY